MAGGYSAPGVYRKEIDLSDVLISQGISNGGIVVRAQKGPVRRPVLVTNNKEYVDTFGEPYYVSGLSDAYNDIGGKLVPELGYGAYGALEFLKESNTLYVVRAFDTNDKYSNIQIDSDGIQGTSANIPVLNTPVEVFDTAERISTYEQFERDGKITDKLLVGYVGPGIDGDNFAVTIDTINPNAEWLYNYDEYPTDLTATVSATDPDTGDTIYISDIWGGSGWITKGSRFNTVSAISGASTDDITIGVEIDNYNGYNCDETTLISSCDDKWVDGYTQSQSEYTVPIEKMSFYYIPYASSSTVKDYNLHKIAITPSTTEELLDGKIKITFMIDVDGNGSYYKYEIILGDSTEEVPGNGGPSEVYKYFPIASEIVKVSVYRKPDDKKWEELYSNSIDAAEYKIRMEPLEVFYGTMFPKQDHDGNELFIEKAINGNSKYIYVKANGVLHGHEEAPTISWDFNNVAFNLSNGNDESGLYVYNTNRLAKLQNGGLSLVSGLESNLDSDMWDYFKNREEIRVNILINTNFNQAHKLAVADVCNIRRDCIGVNQVGDVTDINYNDIINKEKYGYPAPSFMALYAGYAKVYDTYNDKYVYLPNAIYAASVYARVDRISEPWYAPAGTARGVIPVMDQNKIYNLDHIGKMYDRNINSVKYVQGAGFTLWGQKTAQLKTTALDRINVRRELIYIQVNIETFLNQFLFENNTQQTRLRVFSIIDDFLAGIKASEGLYDYSVVCDESNNPPSVIDANQMNVDIYVQPVKTIEFIQFTTVITRTGVSFSDVKLKYR